MSAVVYTSRPTASFSVAGGEVPSIMNNEYLEPVGATSPNARVQGLFKASGTEIGVPRFLVDVRSPAAPHVPKL